MKSLSYLSVFLLFVIANVPTAVADGGKSVTVTNNTTYTLSEFYASPSADSAWDTSTNLMAGQTVAPGQSITITIADGVEHCHYDLMAVLYGAAEYAYQYSVDACEGGSWSISNN
jgi:hypothetical protein